MEPPRRRSKLNSDDLFVPPDQGESTKTEAREPEQTAAEEPPAAADVVPPEPDTPSVPPPIPPQRPTPKRRRRGAPPAPITRNARRVNARGPVSDLDLVSFNCKMTRGLRRAVKHYAADVDVDIQDVVAAALEDYLDERGVPFPGSDQQQPD